MSGAMVGVPRRLVEVRRAQRKVAQDAVNPGYSPALQQVVLAFPIVAVLAVVGGASLPGALLVAAAHEVVLAIAVFGSSMVAGTVDKARRMPLGVMAGSVLTALGLWRLASMPLALAALFAAAMVVPALPLYLRDVGRLRREREAVEPGRDVLDLVGQLPDELPPALEQLLDAGLTDAAEVRAQLAKNDAVDGPELQAALDGAVGDLFRLAVAAHKLRAAGSVKDADAAQGRMQEISAQLKETSTTMLKLSAGGDSAPALAEHVQKLGSYATAMKELEALTRSAR